MISLPRYYQESYSRAKISECCNNKSSSSSKIKIFPWIFISTSCNPGTLKQHQCFEPTCHKKLVGHKDVNVPWTVNTHTSWGLLLVEGWQIDEIENSFKLTLDIVWKLFLICLLCNYSFPTDQFSGKYCLYIPCVHVCKCIQTYEYHVGITKIPILTSEYTVALFIPIPFFIRCKRTWNINKVEKHPTRYCIYFLMKPAF